MERGRESGTLPPSSGYVQPVGLFAHGRLDVFIQAVGPAEGRALVVEGLGLVAEALQDLFGGLDDGDALVDHQALVVSTGP